MADSTLGWQTAHRQAPLREAFHVEWVVDPFTLTKTIGMVRHASHAFVMQAPQAGGAVDVASASWSALGARYLVALAEALQREAGTGDWLPTGIWAALLAPLEQAQQTQQADRAQPRPGQLAWLPITWRRGADGRLVTGDPGASFWVDRMQSAGTVDRSLVLLAGCRAYGLLLGTDMGLRVTLHLRGNLVFVHGVTLAGLGGERALQCPPAHAASAGQLFQLVNALRAPIGLALGQGKPQVQGQDQHLGVWISGLERAREPDAPAHRLRVTGFMRRGPRTAGQQPVGFRSRVHDFSVDVDAPPGGALQVVTVRRNEFAGSAATPGQTLQAFLADGAAQSPAATPDGTQAVRPRARPAPADAGLLWRRPTRSEADLLPLRRRVPVALDADGSLRQVDSAGARDGQVRVLHEVRGPRRSKSVLAASTMAVGPAAVVQAAALVGVAAPARAGAAGPGSGGPGADRQTPTAQLAGPAPAPDLPQATRSGPMPRPRSRPMCGPPSCSTGSPPMASTRRPTSALPGCRWCSGPVRRCSGCPTATCRVPKCGRSWVTAICRGRRATRRPATGHSCW